MTDRLKAWLIAFAAFAMLVGVLVTAAPADIGKCRLTRSEAVETLATKFFEAPKAIGTIKNKNIMEVWVSASGSWTIFITDILGCYRVIAAGENWEAVLGEPPMPGIDS